MSSEAEKAVQEPGGAIMSKKRADRTLAGHCSNVFFVHL